MSDLCVTPKKRAPGREAIYDLPTKVAHPTRRRAVNPAEHFKPKIGGGGKVDQKPVDLQPGHQTKDGEGTKEGG